MTTAPKNTDVDIAERLGYEARRSGISRTQNPYASSPFNDSSLFEDIRALLLKPQRPCRCGLAQASPCRYWPTLTAWWCWRAWIRLRSKSDLRFWANG